jgi:hypothetical protein
MMTSARTFTIPALLALGVSVVACGEESPSDGFPANSASGAGAAGNVGGSNVAAGNAASVGAGNSVSGGEPTAGSSPSMPSNGAGNAANMPSNGAGNAANMPSNGAGNAANVPDEGAGNTANVPDEGAGNTANVPDEGAGNAANVPDEGAGNTANIPNEGAGNAPSGGEVACDISATVELSSAIGTVGIVQWSTSFDVQEAVVEFTPTAGGETQSAPVDLERPMYRTLLLGMKEDTDYSWRVVASNAAGETCASQPETLTTEPALNAIPQYTLTGNFTPGFIVMTQGLGNMGGGLGGGGGGGGVGVFVIDADGDIVWWTDQAPASTSAAHLDFEGNYMYLMSLNVTGGTGDFRGVTLDGLERHDPPQELQEGHHDFAVAPGGVIATGVHENGCSALKEWSPEGGTKVLVASVEELYQRSGDCHPNGWDYQEDTDTYTVSDRNPNLFVKIDRDGNLLWQFGGNNPVGPSISVSESWMVNHGNHLTPEGTFLFFNNGQGQNSPVLEFALDETAMSSNKVWEYTSGNGSTVLGDVQRLPNGHTLVTYSNSGIIQELDGDQVVGEITSGSAGYTDWRPTLYGPPAL